MRRYKKFHLKFDRKKDKVTKELDYMSQSQTKVVLGRNAFRRYLDTRLAYFASDKEIGNSRYSILRWDGKTCIIRLVLRLTNASEFHNRIETRKRGAQAFPADDISKDKINWLCQTIEKSNGYRIVNEFIFSENFLIQKGVLHDNLWRED